MVSVGIIKIEKYLIKIMVIW